MSIAVVRYRGGFLRSFEIGVQMEDGSIDSILVSWFDLQSVWCWKNSRIESGWKWRAQNNPWASRGTGDKESLSVLWRGLARAELLFWGLLPPGTGRARPESWVTQKNILRGVFWESRGLIEKLQFPRSNLRVEVSKVLERIFVCRRLLLITDLCLYLSCLPWACGLGMAVLVCSHHCLDYENQQSSEDQTLT